MKRLLPILIIAASLGSIFCGGGGTNVNTPPKNCPPVSNTMPTENKVVFALFDLSDSADAKETRAKYIESFKKVIDRIGGGDVLVADSITENPLSQSSFPINEPFPSFDPKTDNELLIKKHKEEFDCNVLEKRNGVMKKAEAFVNNTSRAVKQTHIIEAMTLAEKVFSTYQRRKKVLLIFSDMLEESDRYNFVRQKLDDATIIKIINAEKQANRLPNLTGVEVYVVGASSGGSGKASVDIFLNVEKFWMQYSQATGANLAKEHYGAALLSFDE